MTPQPSTPPSAVAWIIDLVVARVVVLPSGESIDRDGFYEWLWGEWGEDGLAGVFEGTVDAPEAVALGLVGEIAERIAPAMAQKPPKA